MAVRWQPSLDTRASALVLVIVSGSAICLEVTTKALISFPTKSHIVLILHKVQIREGAEEPEGCGFLPQPIIHVWRAFENELSNAQVRRSHRIWMKDGSDGEGLRRRVFRFVREFSAKEPSTLNVNWKRLCPSKVREIEKSNRARVHSWGLSFLRNSVTEALWRDANDWQVDGDGCSGGEMGRSCGDACRARHADCEAS